MGTRAGAFIRLATCALVGLGGVGLSRAKDPDPVELPSPSRVFPEGGFPDYLAAPNGAAKSKVEVPPPSRVFPEGLYPDYLTVPEGALPAAPRKKPDYPPPAIHPLSSDYGLGRDVQDAPGTPEFYRPQGDPLPAYFYRPAYYERPVVSPRSVVEYAPPGYEARDQQVAPGTPEFVPIPPPVPVAPEERERFVTRGIFPGSFLVPGSNTSFRLRGFVRLMGLFDFDGIGSRDSFVPNTIPVPGNSDQNYNMGARYSRIAFESWTPTAINEWTVHTFIEGDFFNGNAQAAGAGGNAFRLRHAFIDFGYFRVGQQNTVFMDPSTWPSLVDFQGPAGWANQRRPGARVTLPLADQLFWAGAIEQPFSDIATDGRGMNVQDVPDFATHVRYETDLGHVQVAGLARSIGYEPTRQSRTRRAGYGLSAGTTFHPWALLLGTNPTRKANPTGLERCRVIGQYTCGWGIGRYLQDTVGQGFDGQVDPTTGGFDVSYTSGFVASYEHWYSERWMTALTWSEVQAATNGVQGASTYGGSRYAAASLWYIPFVNMSLGLEYLHGERENVNGQRGTARRVNALVQYNF